MPERLTRCPFGHRWNQVTSFRKPPWGALITLECEGCGLIREDIVNPHTGELDHRNYIKPGHFHREPMTLTQWRKAISKDPRTRKVRGRKVG